MVGFRNSSPIADLMTVDGLEESGAQLEEIFDVLEKAGNIDHKEMYNIFNMGIGMVLAIAPARKDEALKLLADNNEPAYVLGQIAADTTGTQIVLK